MKIVMICTKYSTNSESPYLTDELAEELVNQGHEVTVLLSDWDNSQKSKSNKEDQPSNPKIIARKSIIINWLPRKFRLIIKWALTSIMMVGSAAKLALKFKPDVVIAYSPLMAINLPTIILTSRSNTRKFLVQWDFFPDSHVQNHLIHGKFKIGLLRKIESFLMQRFDLIGCMSPKNIEYLNNNCNLRKKNKGVLLPLWTSFPKYNELDKEKVRQKIGIQNDVCTFVFGGQLIAGRGIEDIIKCTKKLNDKNDKVIFLFIGKGPLGEIIDKEIKNGNKFIKMIGNIPRNEYLGIISTCDVGVVCTVRDVSVPTFPSKTVDYLLAGIPILASVEASTDYGEFIELNKVGHKVLAGDIDSLVSAVRSFSQATESREEISKRSRICLHKNFSVATAAQIITSLVP